MIRLDRQTIYTLATFLLPWTLSLYLFGITAYGMPSLKYIGLYISTLLYLGLWWSAPQKIIDIYIRIFRQERLLLSLFVLFLTAILFSALFGYAGISENLRDFRRSFLNIGIFLIIVLGIEEKIKLSRYFFLALIFAFASNTFYIGYHFLQKSSDVYANGHINRFYSFLNDFLLPFSIVALFWIRSKALRFFVIILLILDLIEVFFTGARGAWVSIAASLVILIIFIYHLYKPWRKRIAITSITAFLLLMAVFAGVYHSSPWVQKKFHEGIFYPNGRDIIIKERFPIFLEYGNLLYGIGGPGNTSYHKFLNDHHAPHHYGVQENGSFRYFSDEPFLLQLFYKEGIIGLSLFVFLLAVMSIKLLQTVKNTRTITFELLFSIAIFTSMFSYFFIRGLVEIRELGFLLFYLALYFSIPKRPRSNDASGIRLP